MSPSPFQRGSEVDRERPEYPDLEEQIGEDPAKFLYSMDPIPRVRGLESFAKIAAYRRVESDGQGRPRVFEALNERADDLRGERIDRDPDASDEADDEPAEEPDGDTADEELATGDHTPGNGEVVSGPDGAPERAGAPAADGAGSGALAADPSELVAGMDVDEAEAYLDVERAKDDPREEVVEALEERLDRDETEVTNAD